MGDDKLLLNQKDTFTTESSEKRSPDPFAKTTDRCGEGENILQNLTDVKQLKFSIHNILGLDNEGFARAVQYRKYFQNIQFQNIWLSILFLRAFAL